MFLFWEHVILCGFSIAAPHAVVAAYIACYCAIGSDPAGWRD